MKKLTTKPLKIVELEHRVAKLEETVYHPNSLPKAKIIIANPNTLTALNVAPPDNSVPVDGAEGSVYDAMRLWLSAPATRRVDEYVKAQSTSNEVRQALFMRQQKAIQKYGEGLKLGEGLKNGRKVIEKLADGAFFLFQTFAGSLGMNAEEIKLVENLHTLLGLLIKEHKNKHA